MLYLVGNTYHTCDNRALVSRINTIRNNNDYHIITNPIDGDIIIPTAFWATKTLINSRWVRGHAERRKDINYWTSDEWANNTSDTYASKAWLRKPPIQCSPTAIQFLHHHSLQIQVPSGSMSGRTSRRLADEISTRRGLQQLQKTLRVDDDLFACIDWETFNIASKPFTKTIYSRAHLTKHIGFQWFTKARAHLFDSAASNRCRCCDDDKIETTEHVLHCSSCKPIQ